jgi:hypothetical protein
MSDTPAPKAPKTPADILEEAVAKLIKAAEAFAASDGTTTHSFTAGDYRVHFQGEQLLRVERV